MLSVFEISWKIKHIYIYTQKHKYQIPSETTHTLRSYFMNPFWSWKMATFPPSNRCQGAGSSSKVAIGFTVFDTGQRPWKKTSGFWHNPRGPVKKEHPNDAFSKHAHANYIRLNFDEKLDSSEMFCHGTLSSKHEIKTQMLPLQQQISENITLKIGNVWTNYSSSPGFLRRIPKIH